MGTRSLRFPISAMLNPAQRAHGSNPSNPCQEPEVFGFPASLSLCDKGYDVVSTIHSGFETQMAFHEKWARAPCDFRFPPCRIPHSGRMAKIPQAPAKNLRFLDFPLLYRFSIKGMTLFLRFIPILKRKWHLKKGCREQGSLPSPLKLKLLRRADCELFRLHRRVLRRRGTRLLLPLADSLLRRLLSLRAHPPHQTVHRRHPR